MRRQIASGHGFIEDREFGDEFHELPSRRLAIAAKMRQVRAIIAFRKL
jgi:hypothetical protein